MIFIQMMNTSFVVVCESGSQHQGNDQEILHRLFTRGIAASCASAGALAWSFGVVFPRSWWLPGSHKSNVNEQFGAGGFSTPIQEHVWWHIIAPLSGSLSRCACVWASVMRYMLSPPLSRCVYLSVCLSVCLRVCLENMVAACL